MAKRSKEPRGYIIHQDTGEVEVTSLTTVRVLREFKQMDATDQERLLRVAQAMREGEWPHGDAPPGGWRAAADALPAWIADKVREQLQTA